MECRALRIVLCTTLIYAACYSFKGISIAPTISTFYVDQFQTGVANAPPDLGQRFSENLKDVILSSSRLTYEEDIPDIEFSGRIASFNVQSVAPQRDNNADGATEFGSALNRLTITVIVDYLNNQNDDDVWNQTFTFFKDFDSNTNLSDVQEELVLEIFDQLTTDIFNRAFTNW